jgi:hypothetical protein
MTKQVILNRLRLRKIVGGFGFIPHRFLRDGFLKALSVNESLLYFFYVLAADRNGVSFYRDQVILEQLGIEEQELLIAQKGLLAKGLIAATSPHIQVLSLPSYAKIQQNPAHQIRKQLMEESR